MTDTIELTWTPCEYAEGESTELAGYTADVVRDDDSAGVWWFWRVRRVTAEISEYPEVYNCDFAASLAAGKTAAAKALRKAVAS